MDKNHRSDPVSPSEMPYEIFMADLNQYDIITLLSLTMKKVGGHSLLITKSGGFWPLLLTKLHTEYYLTHDEVINATNAVYGNIYRNMKSSEKDKSVDLSLFELSTMDLAVSFTKEAIGAKNKVNPKEIIRDVEKKYFKSLEKLERKGLIVDPVDVEGIITLSKTLVEPQNRITDKGDRMINDMSKIIEEQDSQRSQMLRHLKSLFDTFLNEMIMNISIR